LEKNPLINLRGGDRQKVVEEIVKKILKDKALKLALLTLFSTVGWQFFQEEIEALLVDKVFKNLKSTDVQGPLKIVLEILEDHELNLHTSSVKSLIVANNLSNEQKISLLKIKLEYIINGECGGKKRFITMLILSLTITFCVSGVGGLALFLEALYRLFQEGKISKALYEQLLKALAKKWWNVGPPVDHFLDD
jgi:hypothetical protein